MADENNMGLTAEVADTVATIEVPKIKKQRAPRRQKTAAEPVAAAVEATTAKSPLANPQKRGRKPKLVETNVADGRSAGKIAGRKKIAKAAEKAAAVEIDEMADLLQLEEENKRLRKTLADKLRAENVDLRKRLGLD